MRDGEAGRKSLEEEEERSGVGATNVCGSKRVLLKEVTQRQESLEHHPTVTKSMGVAKIGPVLPRIYFDEVA